jgi:hypothetical protein
MGNTNAIMISHVFELFSIPHPVSNSSSDSKMIDIEIVFLGDILNKNFI